MFVLNISTFGYIPYYKFSHRPQRLHEASLPKTSDWCCMRKGMLFLLRIA